MSQLKILFDSLQTVSVYQKVKRDGVVTALLEFLQSYCEKAPFFTVANHYTVFCSALYRSEYAGNLQEHLLALVLADYNKFTESASLKTLDQLPDVIVDAAKQDLQTFYQLSQLTAKMVGSHLREQYENHEITIQKLPAFVNENLHFSALVGWEQGDVIADYHEQHGTGQFAKYRAFYFAESKHLVPIVAPRKVALDELKKYELQKQKVVDNTRSFLAGKPANNVLLYGDRGTGKSTLVHAMLSTFGDQGLRMIQIVKEDVLHLDRLLAQIQNVPLRFVIFIDDLTFNENDPAFNSLKAILEGSLNALPSHVCIYATTNRRHLIKETFSAREGNELHASDTRDESASLADRFGLCLTFMKPNLSEYLEMVLAMAADRNIQLDEDSIKRGASTFATRKGNRSGRVAKQYIDDLEGRMALGLSL